MNETIKNIVENTNERMITWYENAKVDYNVDGQGECVYYEKMDLIQITYIENKVLKTWNMPFYPEYIENGLNWVFDCWASEAK